MNAEAPASDWRTDQTFAARADLTLPAVWDCTSPAPRLCHEPSMDDSAPWVDWVKTRQLSEAKTLEGAHVRDSDTGRAAALEQSQARIQMNAYYARGFHRGLTLDTDCWGLQRVGAKSPVRHSLARRIITVQIDGCCTYGLQIVPNSLRIIPDGSDDGPDKSGRGWLSSRPDLSGVNPAIRFQAEVP